MLTNGQLQAVIFDMDGLLVDSEPVWEQAETAMVAARGKQYDRKAQQHLIGLRADDYLPGMAAIYGIEDTLENLRAEMLQRMTELIPQKVQPQPGAPELLAYLAQQKIPCAIASSSPMLIIETVVASQGWDAVFAARCSGDEVANGKPAPDVYLLAAERLNIKPANCLALEDSPTGARAAVAAGMTCFAVPDSTHTSAAAFTGITDQILASLYDVLAQWR